MAIGNRIAKLVKSVRSLAGAIKSFIGCLVLNILHHLALIWSGSKGLVTIGVAVIVAHYLATYFNGQLLLGLPPETMQVMVELIAVYLLKKQ